MRNDRNVVVHFKPGGFNHDNIVSSVSDTGILGKKIPSSPNSRTYDLPVTGPDAIQRSVDSFDT